jgi:hypothetical protein
LGISAKMEADIEGSATRMSKDPVRVMLGRKEYSKSMSRAPVVEFRGPGFNVDSLLKQPVSFERLSR